MAWFYHKGGYPKNRKKAIKAALSVKEEDIDYSDIPPFEFKKGMILRRLGDKYKKLAGE